MKSMFARFGLLFVILSISSLNLSAQTSRLRTVNDRKRPSTPVKKGELLKISKFYGVGNRAKAETPIYNTSNPRGMTSAKLWYKVETEYETARSEEEWIPELTFRYHVLARKSSQTAGVSFTLYQKNIRYVDIETGSRPMTHRSTAFIRPALIKKNGPVIAAAVEIVLGGEVIARSTEIAPGAQLPRSENGEWWKNSVITESQKTTINRDDMVSRDRSPWALINIDDYEVIK